MKTRWRALIAVVAATGGLAAALIATNPAPSVPRVAAGDGITSTQPYVIKLHARWCPVCLVTKDVWTDVQQAYEGRARLVVFDFTNAAATAASRVEAQRLGLTAVFDDYVGETGTVLVLDGVEKQVRHAIHGSRDITEYRAAIDGVLGGRLE